MTSKPTGRPRSPKVTKQQIERVTIECHTSDKADAWEAYFDDPSWKVVEFGSAMGKPGMSRAVFERVNLEHVVTG